MIVTNASGIGDVVHERRTALGWSQERLAREMGTSRVWVNSFENGKSTAQLRLVLDALTVLGLTVDIIPSGRADG